MLSNKKIFYQDNMSTIKMEKNGRQSCGEKSRHIHISYFFIKNVLARENIDMVHCPTERIIADYFTKPLQGSLFKNERYNHGTSPILNGGACWR